MDRESTWPEWQGSVEVRTLRSLEWEAGCGEFRGARMDSVTGTCRESLEASLAQLAIGLEFPLGLTTVQLLPRPDLLPTAAAPKDTASR